MRPRPALPILGFLTGLALAGSCLVLGPATASLAPAARIVLQRGRHYLPADLYLRPGDTIAIRNGDASTVHHAFIETDQFSFDAGDQEPGTERRLTLTVPGDYVVRCGIHPRMRLTVSVR